MSPQSFSLHPAWDRMYTSGMTVQEIADFTGRARSTVHRHLQVREDAGARLRAVHEAARLARGPDWPTTRWQHCYKAAQEFYKLNGRLPIDDDVAAEHKLVAWLDSQRATHRSGALSAIKVTLMDMIPGWEGTAPQTILDDRWRQRLEELVAFVAETGRMPRYKRHSSEHEHALGVWIHTQHQRRAECRLLDWRLAALDAAVPGWHSSM
ncbi:Helicase associated domain protein [Arthrobacter sp. TWP1-1]|uniref:Helicase associated domain protein n=1 Tax=Arthrobacter sp. TWP1-1 TaxID=2804568 RepID=UPI003CF010D7